MEPAQIGISKDGAVNQQPARQAIFLTFGESAVDVDNVLKVLIENQVNFGKTLVVHDTRGVLTSFVLPFLPGEHVKKMRKFKKRSPEGEFMELLKPRIWVFNTRFDTSRKNAVKIKIPLFKILADLGRVSGSIVSGIEFSPEIPREIINELVQVSFGKDFQKYRDKASAFARYLASITINFGRNGIRCRNWVEFNERVADTALHGVARPDSLTGKEIENYLFTLGYFIQNSPIFSEGMEDPVNNAGIQGKVNFELLYMQDLPPASRGMVLDLLFVEYLLWRAGKATGYSPPYAVFGEGAGQAWVFDELAPVFPRDRAADGGIVALIFSELIVGGSVMIAGWMHSAAVDGGAMEGNLIEPALVSSIPVELFAGKISKKENVQLLKSIVEKCGMDKPSGVLADLRAGHVLDIAAGCAKPPVVIETRQAKVQSFQMRPNLFQKILTSPIMSIDASKPDPGDTVKHVSKPLRDSKTPETPHPRPREASIEPVPSTVDGTLGAPANSTPTSTQAAIQPAVKPAIHPPLVKPRPPVEREKPVNEGSRVDGAMDEPPASPSGGGAGGRTGHDAVEPRLADEEPENTLESEPKVEGAGEVEVEVEAEADDLSAMLDDVETAEEYFEQAFLTDLVHPGREISIKQKGTDEEKLLDFNLVLNSLLFKLEKVLKTPYGLNFFKELISSKRLNWEKSMNMYFEETKKIIKMGFATREGSDIVYHGLDNAIRTILRDLDLDIEIPAKAEMEKLERHFLLALALPKEELLARIKNGSLYF
ncbi:MAG: hypothetical protein ACTSUE_26805 [Promethearchaeota archaeon]